MIEAGWACLLVLAMLEPRARPPALLLAAKWALNYAAALSGLWTLPAYIDLAAGTVGVIWATGLPHAQRAVIVSGFVLAPLVHAAHWTLWAEGVYVGVQYWLVMLGLFSAQVLALAWPRGRTIVGSIIRRARLYHWRRLVGGSAAARR